MSREASRLPRRLPRRVVLKSLAAGAFAASVPWRPAQAQDAFTLPDLPYAVDALEPYIGRETMELHHGRHHAGYVRNLNTLTAGTDLEGRSLEEIVVAAAADRPNLQGVLNNAGQHWNHTAFWTMMTPGGGGPIPHTLESKIVEDFGDVAAFREAFIDTAARQFGSGWGWLALDTDGRLVTVGTPNGENPLIAGQTPLLGVDVWEHAYYLDYRNRRRDYLAAFFDNLVNWEAVAERFDAA